MSIPPEILEQIKKESERRCPTNDEMLFGFQDGAQFGYSLCQKQTPPPTGREIEVYWNSYSGQHELTQASKKELSASGHVMGTKWREVTDGTPQGTEIEVKLAIAVEALRKIEAPDFAQPNTRVDDWLNAWRNTTKLLAREALEKIEGGK